MPAAVAFVRLLSLTWHPTVVAGLRPRGLPRFRRGGQFQRGLLSVSTEGAQAIGLITCPLLYGYLKTTYLPRLSPLIIRTLQAGIPLPVEKYSDKTYHNGTRTEGLSKSIDSLTCMYVQEQQVFAGKKRPFKHKKPSA